MKIIHRNKDEVFGNDLVLYMEKPVFEKYDRVIEISSGNQYVVFDCTDTEIAILQNFEFAQPPFNRQFGGN